MSEFVNDTLSSRRLVQAPPWLLKGLWGLTLVGLLIRALRQPTVAGTYSARLDELLYAGQRLLEGQLLYDGLVNGSHPLVQWLYAPSAWVGSLQVHRLMILALNILAGALLAKALRNLARAGLIALSPGSLLPLAGATLYITGSQLFPEGLSGLTVHFASAFLVVGLFVFSMVFAAGVASAPSRPLALLVAGASMGLAQSCCLRLTSPLVLITVLSLVFLRFSRPLAVVLPCVVGGLAGALLTYAPYLLIPDGPALAWAGAVQLPLEVASRFPGESDRFLPLIGEFLRLNIAGLPVWLLASVPCIGLMECAVRLARQPFGPGDQPMLIPALAVIFLLETLQSFLRGGFESEEMPLLVLPLVVIMVCGFAVMERRGRSRRGIADLVVLLLSFIVFNNVFLVGIRQPPRPPSAMVRALEADRDATRRFLLAQPQDRRGFTAPQDVALQRQLHQRASTTGIGPEWSLNHQQLPTSWATQKLALPTDPAAACRQLTDPANLHLVWMRTDPEGPNTEAFFRSCLNQEPGRWQDISGDLKLTSGDYRVFRRRSLPEPIDGASHAP